MSIAVFVAAFAVCALASSAAARGKACHAGATNQLRHTKTATVFKLPKKGIGPLGESRRSGTYACNSSVGRWFPLVRSSRWLVDRVYLNGDFTAYTIAKKPIAPGGGQPWRLRVMDTRTGGYLHEIDFTYGAFITDFAVGRGGSLAYISYDFVGGDWFYWVKRRDGGGLQVLDKGRDIAEYSLDRSWTTISWISNGRRVSDTLY